MEGIVYYLTQEIPDERATVVNERFAPAFGMTIPFTLSELAEAMGVKLATATRRLERWIYEGYAKEVI